MALPKGTVQTVTLGPLASSYKKRASKKQWAKLVKKAHQRGFTVNSFLDQSTPGPLKQRTRASLKKQALNTVASAYKPAHASVNQEESRANALAAKRRTDLDHFQTWMTGRTAELDKQMNDASTRLRDAQTKIHDDRVAAMGAMQTAAHAQAAANPGNVSNPQDSTALNFKPEQQRNIDQLALNRTNAEAQITTADTARGVVNAAGLAQLAAMEATRQGDLWKRMGELGDDRQKLKFAQASEAAKEVARLLDGEVQKASANRDYGLASQRLGIDAMDAQNDQIADQRKARQDQREFRADQRKARQDRRDKQRKERRDNMEDDRKFQLDQQKFGREQAKDNYQRRNKLGPYAGTKPDKKDKPSETARAGWRSVDDFASRLKANHNVQNPADLHKGKVNLVKGGASRLLVEAAAEIAKYDKLRPATYRRLKDAGAFVPKRYRPKGA